VLQESVMLQVLLTCSCLLVCYNHFQIHFSHSYTRVLISAQNNHVSYTDHNNRSSNFIIDNYEMAAVKIENFVYKCQQTSENTETFVNIWDGEKRGNSKFSLTQFLTFTKWNITSNDTSRLAARSFFFFFLSRGGGVSRSNSSHSALHNIRSWYKKDI
jgi:hypothetical protein